MKHNLKFALALTMAAAVVSPAAAVAVSGRFEQLDLAIGEDGRLLGSYREVQGEGVTKTCAFTLSGSVDATGHGKISASAETGPAQSGTIFARADAVVIALPNGRDFPGCGSVLMPEIAKGLELTKTGSAAWTSLVRIAADRARLHTAPASATTHGYMVRGNIAGVTGSSGDWLAVEFRGDSGRSSKGWIARSETAPLRTSDRR